MLTDFFNRWNFFAGKKALAVKCSIVIAVLESYEAVRRQMLYFYDLFDKHHVFKKTCRIILVDDGSNPSLYKYLQKSMPFNFTAIITPDPSNGCTLITMNQPSIPLMIIETHDTNPWTQPKARNIGAAYASGEYLFMTDIDHILTHEAISAVLKFKGDRMLFPRKTAILNKNGEICRERMILMKYGYQKFNPEKSDSHVNTFAIKR
ncbi:MAG: glycosyltransferase family A protein, partial [Bacillota bacterium]|nr:glycosyltransferase family A protein [Bacillota bacterium]